MGARAELAEPWAASHSEPPRGCECVAEMTLRWASQKVTILERMGGGWYHFY